MKTNPYANGGYEAIRTFHVPEGLEMEPFPLLEELGILAVVDIDPVESRLYGMMALSELIVSGVFRAIWMNHHRGDEGGEGSGIYARASNLDWLVECVQDNPETAMFCYVDLDQESKVDRIFVLGRRLTTDDFALSVDDIRFGRECLIGKMRALEVPLNRALPVPLPVRRA